MIENLLQSIMSEYGVFVGFLVATNGLLLYTIKILYNQNISLGNKLLKTIEQNTRVMTQIVDRLDSNAS